MEVKIGVQYAPREIVMESKQTPDELESTVAAALEKGSGLLSLEDEHGRKILIPADRVAYIEIGQPSGRKVGFGAI
ncbi:MULTISPECIES: DUF3107 domain-containing protein [Streptomyces]|uniref:DUF3107 domain-containing protein n=3 Tax=Streptomyces TaxID=1883 RepID=A0A367EN20_9ACTN|nr:MULTISPECIES: DUF3107 domain-containing protein [Streptomyces]RCG19516.1 DUF3107 domain-containing protein [Streptomyces diacarni]RCG22601.1 DUF3107 domain-containing protein [Streptomyces reniochalinae]UNS98819.1 DUF3107 domain-containing protein [Streptomyces tubbatahanensis]